MSEAKREYIQLLNLALEEGRLCDVLETAQSCGVLEPELEERVKEVISQHKESLIDYLNDLWSRERRNCRAGLAFSYGVLELIENFEDVYGLKEKVEVSEEKSISLRRLKKRFKKSPNEFGLGLVPRKLTSEQNGSFANLEYRWKMQDKLVPEIIGLGLGEEQVRYVTERTWELLKALPLLRY